MKTVGDRIDAMKSLDDHMRHELAKFCARSKVEIPDDEWDAALNGVEPPQSIFNVGGLLL